MAHFAQIDENNIVLQVSVIDNSDITDANGVEQESLGVAICKTIYGGNWVQTSYNANMRGKYAGIGDYYDELNDVFITPTYEQITGEPI